MPDPVFNEADRVPTPSGLPKELEGKTPAEVAAYYQQREQRIVALAKDAIKTNDTSKIDPPKQGTVQMTRTTDPAPGATTSEIESARITMAAVARDKAMTGKKYWSKFADTIDGVMAKMGPDDRANYLMWEAVYNNQVGQNLDTINREEKEAAETARIASERPNPTPENVPPPPPLPLDVTRKILPGLGLTEERYRKGQEQIAKGEWPLTFNNEKVGA